LCPELDDEEIEMLRSILEAMADNVDVWEFDYMNQHTKIEKYKNRYEYSYNAFKDLVKLIRFMPNTQ
jgi:hypothetical protein